LIAVGLTFAVLGSWSMNQLVEYTNRTFQSIADVTR
jgi:flagellar biosynthesis protein FliQ